MGHDAKINPNSREFAGGDEVLDSRGRPLQVGDEIILHTPDPTYMRVAKIVPNLDPRVPPGTMTILFSGTYLFSAQRNTPNSEFIRVRLAEECGDITKNPKPGGSGLVAVPPEEKP